MKTCSKCKQKLSLDNFHKNRTQGDGYQNQCAKCKLVSTNIWRKNNPHKLKAANIKLTYNLDYDKYLEMCKNGCNACGSMIDLCVDHDHNCCPSTKKICGKCIRGILCRRCNRVEGMLNSDPKLAIALAKYMERNKRDKH